ncbi:MAG: hypothetical protein OEN56_11640 [Gemmatimonadota bacterium]|nr:hypothetical protein [Gemmatimonadota bacterium]
MAIGNRGVLAAALAQMLGQAVTAWALLAHAAGWPEVSIWVVVPLVAAIAVPFRHDGSFRDRATSNFAAAIVASGILWWEVILGGLDGLLGGSGPTLGLVGLLLLVSTVLFSVAGGVFWVLRSEDT